MTMDGRNDFDFFFGRWRIDNRRLRRRLANDTAWDEFEATGTCAPILGGLGNIDSFDAAAFPDGRPLRGMTLRLFDPAARMWSIYWADDRSFALQPPVVGRFEGGRGVFLGDDTFAGRPIRVRFIWGDVTATSAAWEQAFSTDGGVTWETNWYMKMTRA